MSAFSSNSFGVRHVAVMALLIGSTRLGRTLQEDDPNHVPGIVDARTLRIVDAEGNVRGVWGVTADGGLTTLSLLEKDGTQRINLTLDGDGVAQVSVADRKGNLRTTWGHVPEGPSALFFFDEGNKTRGQWIANADGTTDLTMCDASGRRRALLGIGQTGMASVMIFDEKDGPAALLGHSAEGGSALSLFTPPTSEKDSGIRFAASTTEQSTALHLNDHDGVLRGVWSLSKDGQGLSLQDRQGRARAVFGTTPDGSGGLLAFDAGGQVLHRAPEGFDLEGGTFAPEEPEPSGRRRTRR